MPATFDISADLDLALELADAADAVTTSRYLASDLVVETKPDLTPVSEADRDAEARIRAILEVARPDDAVLGEEGGLVGSDAASRRWILDPIDGTKNFVRGVPVWGTLIGLEVDGTVAVGVVSAPALGRRWWGARGQGAFVEGVLAPKGPLRVSGVRAIADASIAVSDVKLANDDRLRNATLAIERDAWRMRGYGDFWMHMLVAEGALDAAFESDVKAWDLAPLQVIVEEAGGRFSDLAGNPGIDGGSAVSTNGLLHEAVIAYY